MIVPPFAGVKLIEHRDRIELTPVYWVREFVGLGRFRAGDVAPARDGKVHPFYAAVMGDREIWVVAAWRRFDDGTEEPINLVYLDPDATEAEARKSYDSMVRFMNHTKEELQKLTSLFKASEDDLAYVEQRFPDVKIGPPESGSRDDLDVYQARLKVLAGMQPKTVGLIHQADESTDPQSKEKFEREAVHAYFAEMAHGWTEDLVKEWQRKNPVGTEWLCEFARVMAEPERDIDPINFELALNWIRRRYNLLTPEELSDAILIATGQRLSPGTLKKRRERLGLTTKRSAGAPPKSSL